LEELSPRLEKAETNEEKYSIMKLAMKLAIGIPNTGTIKSQTVFALVRMLKDFPYEYDVIFQEGAVLHQNRITIVKTAISYNCTHLLFLDSDMYFDKNTVIKLLERKKDIVGVNCNLRKFPLTSTVIMSEEKRAKLREEHPDGFTTCDSLGTGFLLINLDVFKKISEPWFFWESNDKGELVMGEDFWFCKKAKESGYEIWVDFSVLVKHIGDFLY